MQAVRSSPRRPRKTKARRALHRMALAGTVPLLAKIPSPVTERRTGGNVPADAAQRATCNYRVLVRGGCTMHSTSNFAKQGNYLAEPVVVPALVFGLVPAAVPVRRSSRRSVRPVRRSSRLSCRPARRS